MTYTITANGRTTRYLTRAAAEQTAAAIFQATGIVVGIVAEVVCGHCGGTRRAEQSCGCFDNGGE